MEISDLKRQMLAAIDRARRDAAERRVRIDDAGREYQQLLDRIAIPLFRQVAGVLRAENYQFSVATPGGSVRLMSERSSEDYLELMLDTSGEMPRVLGRASRGRGRRILESERPIGAPGPVRDITEHDVLEFVLSELAPFVEK
jgi:hypothetical protein